MQRNSGRGHVHGVTCLALMLRYTPYIMDGFSTSVEHSFVNFDAFKMVVAAVVVPCSGAHTRDAGPHPSPLMLGAVSGAPQKKVGCSLSYRRTRAVPQKFYFELRLPDSLVRL